MAGNQRFTLKFIWVCLFLASCGQDQLATGLVAADNGNYSDVAGELAIGDVDQGGADASADGSATADDAITDVNAPQDIESSSDSTNTTGDAADDSVGPADAVTADAVADAADTSGQDIKEVTDSIDDSTAGDAADSTDGGDGLVGAQPCVVDKDCPSSVAYCRGDTHSCVQCTQDSQCPSNSLCQAYSCQAKPACKSDVDCKATGQVCDKILGICADCIADTDCAVGEVCSNHLCQVNKACKSSKDCPAVCDQVKGLCVQCLTSADCDASQFCSNSQCVADVCSGNVCAGNALFGCSADGGAFLPGTTCNDNNPCTSDSCSGGACVFANVPSVCDDGSICTVGDVCKGGSCQPGTVKNCDDNNLCTTDSCNALSGCKYGANSAPCDDGLACTQQDACQGGICTGKPLICNDNNPCTADTCAAGVCSFVVGNLACSDGNVCTVGDTCSGGICLAGPKQTCNDGNPCTTDACDPLSGCVGLPVAATCDDGNACTTSDTCVQGKCLGNSSLCNDNNPCTTDSCGGGNCVFVAQAGPCDDGLACTDNDLCTKGKCAGTAKVCNDNNPCTSDVCVAQGCSFSALVGQGCSDGDPCTSGDTCQNNGICLGKAIVCSDGNLCTDDSCAGGFCVFTNNTNSCGAVGGCNQCSAGSCTAGSAGFDKVLSLGAALDNLNGVAEDPSGAILAVGYTANNANGNGNDAWLTRINVDGSAAWNKVLGSSGDDHFDDILAIGNGIFAVVGAASTPSSGGTDAWFITFDSAGNQLVSKTFGTLPAVDNAHCLTAVPNGVVTLGSSVSGAVSSGWGARLGNDGSAVWSLQYPQFTAFMGVAAMAGGQNVLFSATTKGAQTGTDVVWGQIGPDGVVKSTTSLLASSQTDWVAGPILGSDGAFTLAYAAGTSNILTVARINAQGSIFASGSKQLPGSSGAIPLNLIAQANGYTVISGYSQLNNGTDDGLIARVDASGQFALLTTISHALTDHLHGGLADAAGLLIVGYRDLQYNMFSYVGDGWLLRLSASGSLSCQCSQNSDCDDKNACTQDTCSGGSCSHTNLSLGTVCTGGTCDGAGTCNPSVCGNGICETGETAKNCPTDCGGVKTNPCNSAAACGVNAVGPTGCGCDMLCKLMGTCCQADGSMGATCTGSTCQICQ